MNPHCLQTNKYRRLGVSPWNFHRLLTRNHLPKYVPPPRHMIGQTPSPPATPVPASHRRDHTKKATLLFIRIRIVPEAQQTQRATTSIDDHAHRRLYIPEGATGATGKLRARGDCLCFLGGRRIEQRWLRQRCQSRFTPSPFVSFDDEGRAI